jgi:hypothetical protein
VSQQNATPAIAESEGTGQMVQDRAESTSDIQAAEGKGTRVIDPVPSLDELMPPLDRTGRRGRMTKDERDYLDRRDHLAKVLERLASVEAALTDVRNSNVRLAADAENVRLGSAELEYSVSFWQRAHDRVQQRRHDDSDLSRRAMMTVNALTRLTGLEVSSVQLDQDFVPVVYRLGLDPYYAQINPYTLSVNIGGNGRRETTFRLTPGGKIQPLHEMAILTFLGLQRDMKEALSKAAFDLLFQTPPTSDVALLLTADGPHSHRSYESIAEFMAHSQQHTAQNCPFPGQCKEHDFNIRRQEYGHPGQQLNKPNPGL